ncbi:hypothetical protein [Actinoplanes sp. HUAS TT8]|uniref:hypothetical protein n=1 Tax=Actinoplanes sp. HUAS TT8 TaxID=3447453 RepID=UPI003F51EC59
MTTNATEQLHTTTPDDLDSPSRLRQAVTTVRTSRPAQAVSTHRKPVAATLLALTATAAAALFLLRKRLAKPAPRPRFPFLRRA